MCRRSAFSYASGAFKGQFIILPVFPGGEEQNSMYTALYRAYRPEVFDELLGQEHIVKILRNQIATDSTSHAYLFCGTRGTGKTTTARILAKGLNCTSQEGERPCGRCSACRSIKEGTFLDVIEIDAASNNGVDNIRELRESVKYPPAAGRKKVYIIDEVHMLSSGAYNALLKTLEEPPEYVVFILATTEPQKLPATILSRCMRLDFRRVPETVLINGMSDICAARSIDVSEDALRIIAANADGSVRDGLSILDQCISGGDKTVNARDVLEFLGASGEETFTELTDLVRRGRTADALILTEQVLSDGKDVRQFMRDWVNHYRNLLMTKFIKNPQDIINLSLENIERIRRQSESIDMADINRGILELSRTMREAKWSTQPRILLELAVVELSSNLRNTAAAVRTAVPAAQAAYVNQDMLSGQTAPADRRMQPAQPASGVYAASLADSEQRSPYGTDRNTPAGGMFSAAGETVSADREETAEKPGETFDLDAIWKAVFEDGEAAKGSFYIIGVNGHLKEIGEYDFTVVTESEHAKNLAAKNRDLLESLMEKHTHKRRTMNILTAGEESRPAADRTAEDLAREAENALGIKVEIQ
jgi:DNA polymerase III subunit gamma/tau